MSPRKRQYADAAERHSAFRERKRQENKRAIQLWLTEEGIEALNRLAKELRKERGELVEELIRERAR